MIADHDRSYFIGASDTRTVMGNWETDTFAHWWRTKQGIENNHFTNDAMLAGTFLEHRILESLGIPMEFDKQIIDGRLRINLDGNTKDCIYECKTYRLSKGFLSAKQKKPSTQYIQQVQVQMYAAKIYKAKIIAYGLEDEDYINFYRDIDPNRLMQIDVEYDEKFIEKYLKRFNYLSKCLDMGAFPKGEECEEQ